MTSRKCLVCNGSFEASGMPGLLSCTQCQFVAADVSLSDEELGHLYGEDYFHGNEYRDYVADRRTHDRHFRARLKTLLRYVNDPRQKELFEIGCAYGFFLAAARSEFRAVSGIDISQHATDYARQELGLPVLTGDFLQLPNLSADVICMWDTIEHLRFPAEYIERASEVLKPGGTIAITTGDIGSAIARWRGKKWRQIHPPTHLHYFSRTTLCRLLEKHHFIIRYVAAEGQYRSVDTMAWIILRIKRNQPVLYNLLKRAGLLDWDLYLNTFDIMYVIAEKTI